MIARRWRRLPILICWIWAVCLAPAFRGQSPVADPIREREGNPRDPGVERAVQAVRDAPNEPAAHFALGVALYRAKRYEDASKAFGIAATRFPEGSARLDAYYNWGNSLAMAGQLAESLSAYRNVLRRRSDAATLHNYARVLEWQSAQSSSTPPPPELKPRQMDALFDQAQRFETRIHPDPPPAGSGDDR
ncbi:MAG: tetratricopeptide repeat protein [Vicinamibacterales bacterium]